jgi:AcrR family transcriptional regulator
MPRVDDTYIATRRQAIIDAAMTCFARDGFHRTTMQDIVRETQLSAGAIYRYFPSKEDIVAAIAQERHAAEAGMLADAAARVDVDSALRDLIHVSLGRLTDPGEQRWRRITVQVWAEALRDERVMEIVRRGLDDPLDAIGELIRRAQERADFPPDIDPEAASRVFASVFYGLVLQQAWDPDLNVEAYIRTVARMIDLLARPNGSADG